MRAIYFCWLIQIDITNHCLANRNCIYCSRFVRHIRDDQKFFMDLDIFRLALESVKKFPKKIGIIGGEPTLHPQFEDMCKLIKEILPNKFVQLFTTGGPRYRKYQSLIERTFNFVALNEHTEAQKKLCKHQPLTIAIQDVVKDKSLMWKMIDDCWVQKRWCPTIGHKGAFFCEIAYAIDNILDGPGGYEIEPNWWKRLPHQFRDQVERCCPHCGAPVPLQRDTINNSKEKFSKENLELYRSLNLPRVNGKYVELFNQELTPEIIAENRKTWAPWNYRGDICEDQPEER